jgi:hypothetical protein
LQGDLFVSANVLIQGNRVLVSSYRAHSNTDANNDVFQSTDQYVHSVRAVHALGARRYGLTPSSRSSFISKRAPELEIWNWSRAWKPLFAISAVHPLTMTSKCSHLQMACVILHPDDIIATADIDYVFKLRLDLSE